MWRRGLLLGLVAVLTVAGATPAGAAPELQLSPATGAAGETFTVRGTGFAASDVEIRWGGQSGELLATAAGPDFSVDATVPDVGPNSYPVVAVVREGGSVSTSNAPFQVSPAVQAIPTRGGAAIDAPSRGGGIDGGLPDTTSGVDADPDPPTVTTAPATTTPATTQATVAPAETAVAAVPTTAVAAPDAAVAAVPVSPTGSTGTVAGGAVTGEERGAGALSPASTSRSPGAVQSPTLLVAGLGLVVAGTVALLVRARRARGGQYLRGRGPCGRLARRRIPADRTRGNDVASPVLRLFGLGGPRVRRAVVAGAMVLGVAGLGSGTSFAVPFSNTAPIELPGPGPGVPGPTPSPQYPSNIVVSGLTGTVTDVNVTLNGLDCSSRGPDFAYPEDVDILLVGPTGANAVIFSDVGGENEPTANQFGPINVTLDDQAANSLPADTQLAAGTYRPVDDDNDPDEQPNTGTVDTFPPPAPAPSGNTALSTFNGTNPNGTWSLYVVDDYPGPNNCRIGGGWTLDILTTGTTTTGGGPTTTGGGPTTTAQVTTTTSAPTTTTSTTTSTSTTTTTILTTTSSSTTSTSTTVPTTCNGLTATIVGTGGPDTITGTAGNDVISAGAGNDSVSGGGGDDVICGGAGNDRLRGEDGNDRIFGDAGVDQLFGDAGNDTLNGGADPDQCYRGPGDTTATCEQIVPVAV